MDLIEAVQYIRNHWWVLPVGLVSAYALGYAGAKLTLPTPSTSETPAAIVEQVEENPPVQDAGLESKVDECAKNREWDERNLRELLRSAETSRVTMFGIAHGDWEGGDKRDGEFVAGLLPHYKNNGFDYVAVECPSSLNDYLDKENFEEEAKRVFKNHWREFGPVIMKARELGMTLFFYDNPELDISNEREQAALDALKSSIFDKDPKAKVVIYAGGSHAFPEPIQASFLNPTIVKTLRCRLDEEFTRKGEVVSAYLEPEEPTGVGFSHDFSFYLGKQCAGEEKNAR